MPCYFAFRHFAAIITGARALPEDVLDLSSKCLIAFTCVVMPRLDRKGAFRIEAMGDFFDEFTPDALKALSEKDADNTMG